MLSYFYKLTPFVLVGAVVLLSLPWLGLIALIIVSLVALPALAFAIVYVPYLLIRAIVRSWQGQGGAIGRTPAAQPAFRKGYVS
jgi:phosphate/sulfate permease